MAGNRLRHTKRKFRHDNSQRGLWNGGIIPLGYDRNPKTKAELAVNKVESASVRKIFEVFLEQETIRKTQAAIIELGIYNKKYTNNHIN